MSQLRLPFHITDNTVYLDIIHGETWKADNKQEAADIIYWIYHGVPEDTWVEFLKQVKHIDEKKLFNRPYEVPDEETDNDN